jgi:ABC-2 type transport system permease protein
MRLHVILAVLKRNVASYFTGVLGYLFITAFVALSVALAFDAQFFTNNDCSLDRLTDNFHWLLLFIVPAITMTAWAEERRQGTDELLFTLPARDFEILLGKYGAVLTVYTIALFFTFPLVIALNVLGSPDVGSLVATYIGYWLAGAAMLSVGMFASSLTNSSTVAFVLAAIICSLFVFIDELSALRGWLEGLGIREPLGVSGYLNQFGSGMIPFGGVVYFLSITALFLYLNSVMIARRHWQGVPGSASMGIQYLIRAASLAVVVTSLSYATSVLGGRADLTKGSLFSLSDVSRKTVAAIDSKRPVTLTAYVSQDVPKEYLPVQKKLQGLLQQFDKIGGSNVDVRVVPVEPLSEEAEEASNWGIQPRQVQSERDGRFQVEEIFLGAVASSGFDQVVIPYFEKGTPVEFELTRAIGTVSKAEKKTIGILTTDAKAFGGFNMQSFQSDPEWRLVTELKRQYNVREISPDQPIPVPGAPKLSAAELDALGDKAPKQSDEKPVDVLVAIMPSTLTQEQMKNLVDYVKAGGPTLIFDDPAPVFAGGLGNSPNVPNKPGQQGGMFGGGAPGAPKADGGKATSLMDAIGVDWDTRSILFDNMNPHPKHEERFPKQLVFVTSGASEKNPGISQTSSITSGMQEILAWFSGEFTKAKSSKVEFTPLLETRAGTSGGIDWDEATQAFGFGGQRGPNFEAKRVTDNARHTIAARIKGTGGESADAKANVIFVADVDLVTDVMFNIFDTQIEDLVIDNTLFVMNCVDSLAGAEDYVRLRSRRPEQRPLTRIEEGKKKFDEVRTKREQEANKEADKSLLDAKDRLEKVLKDIREDKTMDESAKMVVLENRTAAENRKLELEQKSIDQKKARAIKKASRESHDQVKSIERRTWFWTFLLCVAPSMVIGAVVLAIRWMNEDSGAATDRLVTR